MWQGMGFNQALEIQHAMLGSIAPMGATGDPSSNNHRDGMQYTMSKEGTSVILP